MIEKIIMLLKRVFGINSTKLLPQMSAEGVGNIKVSNFSIVNSSNHENTERKSKPVENPIEEYIGKDLISYVFDNKEELTDDSNKEMEFTYDIYKAEEMNKKIDYYKKHTDDLYSLPLEEILEMNYYYKIRVEKLEKKTNRNTGD